ncbi:MAG: Na+/H+ antiporter NhaA [Aquihabitans sp.]
MTSPPPQPSPQQPKRWIQSERRLARLLGRPVQAFLEIEAASGLLLVVATVVAIGWANSPARESYQDLFHTEIALSVGSFELRESLTHWINDALMAVFFFVVGLEIKREWVAGELRDRRAAALPAFAALGGMVVPAIIFVAINTGGAGAPGWGIPVATDIAFALGVVALLGNRVPTPLKVFLLTLAIVDDIGAILIIAIFYSSSISLTWLAGAAAVVVAVVALRRAHVVFHPAFVVLGVALWLCVYESGAHATLAGVAMGLLTPATPFLPELEAEEVVDTLENQSELSAVDVRRVGYLIGESVPLTDRLLNLLHPWSSYVIVPLFALANAGIELSTEAFTGAGALTGGVVAGLVIGKTIGISAFSWLAIRLGFGAMPADTRFPQLVGVAILGGIGFTVSIFVAGLAFTDEALIADAKIGVLVASVIAAAAGALVITLTSGTNPDEVEASAAADA